MSYFIIILNILELTACITGFLFWNKIKNTYWKWFPVYLAVIFLSEIIAEYILHGRKILGMNINLYSYFTIPLEFLFLYWLFFQQFKNSNLNKWPLISAAVYFICLVADLTYSSKIKFFFESFSNTIGCVFLLILLLFYFHRFLNSAEIINYRQSMMFWVSTGILIFYIGTMPFFAFRITLYREYNQLFYIYWHTQFILNWLMYLSFTVAFIWGKPK